MIFVKPTIILKSGFICLIIIHTNIYLGMIFILSSNINENVFLSLFIHENILVNMQK